MAVDMFLKLDGIDGESLDAKHKGEIEISSFSWGVQNQGSAGSGGGAGKVSVQDFHFSASVSKASPKLFEACCTGTHIAKAQLTVRKAGKDQFEYMKLYLQDCLVSSYQLGGDNSGSRAIDQFSFTFQKIEYLYTVQTTGEMVDIFVDFTQLGGGTP